jgi:thiazole synthase
MFIKEAVKVPVIVDAGIGCASDAVIAMEIGADGVLTNSALAYAKEPILMAEAMKHAVIAGRKSYLGGRMAKKAFALASSPSEGIVEFKRG